MNRIEIFQAKDGAIEFKSDVQHETIWASQEQIAELDKLVVCAKFAYTTSHGAMDAKTK